MNAISMNGPGLDAPLALRRKNFRTNNYVDIIADSRSADANTSASGPAGLSGVHWFNWAQVLGGNRMRLLNNYGISGARSDEYLAGLQNTGVVFRGGMQMALNSPAGWLIFGYPAANDIGQASAVPYINRNGVAVTVANVAEVCASNIIAAANQALAIGKRVILSTEPGSPSFNPAQVAAVHEVNLRLRAYAQVTDGVYLWSPLPVLWDPATSATAIVFRAGMLRVNDFVHFSVRGGKAAGTEFARFMTTMMPALDVGIATRAEGENGSAINPRQLGRNQLFTALTGGTVAAASAGSGGGTGTIAVTGDVPASWTLQGPAVASCTITSAAHPDGFGNKVTLDLTTTAAASVAFSCAAPSVGAWNLADTLQFGIDIEVAAGAANAHAYSNLGINTNNGGANYYTLHGSAPFEPYPTDAYAGRLLSQEARPLAGATAKSFLQGQVFATFARAGNLRITLSRASIERLVL